TAAIGAVLVLAAPFSLIDPQGFYSSLLKPSLAALWVSQLIVFAVYPLFARKRRWRTLPAWTLGAGASALAVYGLVITFQQTASGGPGMMGAADASRDLPGAGRGAG